MVLSEYRESDFGMALDEDRIDSDVANLQVAYDKALEDIQEHLKGGMSAPGLFAVVGTIRDRLYELCPPIALNSVVDPQIEPLVTMAIMQAFFTGLRWGESGIQFYMVPAHEACDDPSHDHHKSRLN